MPQGGLPHRQPDRPLWRQPHRGARTCHAARFRFGRDCRTDRGAFLDLAHAAGRRLELRFIGATTIVARSHRPEERTKVQSFNDFLIFGSMALGSLASGMILATYGWIAVNGVLFPPIVAAGALLLWLMIRERRHVSG